VSIPASAPIPADLADAYAWCERFARSHYENFPVASYLLPKAVRPHIAAIYAFARSADDFADEGQRPHEERYRLLEDWRELLWRAAESSRPPSHGNSRSGQGNTGQGNPGRGNAGRAAMADAASSQPHSPLFRALGHTIRVCDLQVSLLEDLLSAFRQDVATTRYATWADLLDYCRRSANPVGRLVLRVCGYAGRELESASDAVCTALQLTNFWQDLAIDYTRGRLYLPREEWEAVGAAEADLAAGRLSPAWRAAVSKAGARTRGMFGDGRAVCDLVQGRLRYELRVTWLGGMLILDRLEETGYDVFTRRPTIGKADVPALAWRAIRWSRPEGGAGRSGTGRDGAGREAGHTGAQ
jgi:phytoene synthase